MDFPSKNGDLNHSYVNVYQRLFFNELETIKSYQIQRIKRLVQGSERTPVEKVSLRSSRRMRLLVNHDRDGHYKWIEILFLFLKDIAISTNYGLP